MRIDITHELPTLPDTRWFELRAFWQRRMREYWSLGAVAIDSRYW